MNFIATIEDLGLIIDYMLNDLSHEIWEAYSPIDHSIRKIASSERLKVFGDAKGNLHFGAWHPVLGSEPIFETFKLSPEIGKNRTKLTGPNIMFTVQGAIDFGCLKPSRFVVWSEAGARQRSVYSDAELNSIDWKALQKESGRIKRYIRNKLTVAKIGSTPILHHAFLEFEAKKFSLGYGKITIGPDSKHIRRVK